MIAGLLLLAQAAAPPPIPTDWSALPPLPWKVQPRIMPALNRFVAGEVAAGRCAASRPAGRFVALDVPMAVRVRADATVRAVVPRAIACPSVEQFASGLIISFARKNLRVSPEGWYQVVISFSWKR